MKKKQLQKREVKSKNQKKRKPPKSIDKRMSDIKTERSPIIILGIKSRFNELIKQEYRENGLQVMKTKEIEGKKYFELKGLPGVYFNEVFFISN